MDSATLPPVQFKDRKVGLVIFGVATALMGCVCGLLVPLMILGVKMAPQNSANPPPPNGTLISVGLLYSSMAVVLIWLGIGSIKARRWARALLAIWSWSWLIAGLLSVATFAMMAPRIADAIRSAQRPGQPELSGSANSLLMLVPIIVLGFMFVLLPLIWALFYSGKNVKATCEVRDPVMRWTDRCPLPVLTISLWLAFAALTLLLIPILRPVAPFFGVLLSGAAASVLYILLAVVWGYCAWALYHLDRRAWWVVLATIVLFAVSNFITYSRHDVGEVYALMGYSSIQVEEVRKLGIFGKETMPWTGLLFTLPFVGLLLHVRKFFTRPPQTWKQANS